MSDSEAKDGSFVLDISKDDGRIIEIPPPMYVKTETDPELLAFAMRAAHALERIADSLQTMAAGETLAAPPPPAEGNESHEFSTVGLSRCADCGARVSELHKSDCPRAAQALRFGYSRAYDHEWNCVQCGATDGDPHESGCPVIHAAKPADETHPGRCIGCGALASERHDPACTATMAQFGENG